MKNFWFVASGEQSNYDYDYDSGEQPNYDEPPTCPCPHNIQLLDLQKNIQVSNAVSNPKKKKVHNKKKSFQREPDSQ